MPRPRTDVDPFTGRRPRPEPNRLGVVVTDEGSRAPAINGHSMLGVSDRRWSRIIQGKEFIRGERIA